MQQKHQLRKISQSQFDQQSTECADNHNQDYQNCYSYIFQNFHHLFVNTSQYCDCLLVQCVSLLSGLFSLCSHTLFRLFPLHHRSYCLSLSDGNCISYCSVHNLLNIRPIVERTDFINRFLCWFKHVNDVPAAENIVRCLLLLYVPCPQFVKCNNSLNLFFFCSINTICEV